MGTPHKKANALDLIHRVHCTNYLYAAGFHFIIMTNTHMKPKILAVDDKYNKY